MSISAHNYNYYTEWQTWRTAVFECTAALSYSETVAPRVTCIPPPRRCNAPDGVRMGRTAPTHGRHADDCPVVDLFSSSRHPSRRQPPGPTTHQMVLGWAARHDRMGRGLLLLFFFMVHSVRHATCDMQHATFETRHAAYNM